MNREQKRKYINKLKKKGYSQETINSLLKYKDDLDNRKYLQEGQKVKLNLNKMKSHPDYYKSNKKRRDWIELHKDNIFTVKYDKKYIEDPIMVCLKEDENEPKWLFWEFDLEVVEGIIND